MVTAPEIPGHEVLDVVGQGGFATVYRTWQRAVGREVAVKIDNRVLLSERDRRRFIREVTAAGRLSGHPHVIDLYDAGTLTDGRPYQVMELCPAGSLDDALRRHGPMSPAQVRDIGVKIADALTAAHAAGVLHRDIKPANILINRYGVVGLSDFGLASITAIGVAQSATREALTPAFAPPEAFRSEEPTAAADIYALAATLYALLAGRPPCFPAYGRPPDIMAIMMQHGKPVEDVPGVPPELMAILRQALESDPAKRPPTAAALRDALRDLDATRAAPLPQSSRVPTVAVAPVGHSQVGPPSAGAPSGPGRASGPAWPVAETGPDGLAPPGQTSGPGRLVTGNRPDDLDWSSQASGPHRLATGGGPDRPVTGSGPDGLDRSSQAGRLDLAAAAPATRSSRAVLAAVLAALAVCVALAAAAVYLRSQHHSAAAPNSAPGEPQTGHHPPTAATAGGGGLGVPTVVSGCPAAAVPGARARCPAVAECWGGLVVISGAATAEPLPCAVPHTWQTFAIAPLPADAQTFDQPTLEANPTVRAVCSIQVLLRSRRGQASRTPPGEWQADVLPPTETAYGGGSRTYRCVAARIGDQPAQSAFGP